MSAPHADAPHDCGAAPGANQSGHIRHAIEVRLGELLPKHGNRQDALTEAMRHAVLGAGKRVRPMLLMSVAHDLGEDASVLVDLACAIEIVHAASLILDDLPCMDDATLRRGHPTIHRRFGQDVAVLAAVALVSHAFAIVAGADGVAPAMRTRLLTVLAQAVGAQGLARGQFDDLYGGQGRQADDIAMTNALKTGALLGLAIEMTAIVAQTNARVTHCLRQFAAAVGQAFQIRDDLLDAGMASVLARDESIGKDTGQDVGKATLPNTLGVEGARIRMAMELRLADGYLQQALGPGNQTRYLVAALFAQCGVTMAGSKYLLAL